MFIRFCLTTPHLSLSHSDDIPTNPQKQDELNISDHNESNVDSNPTEKESDSKASENIIACDTNESKESTKEEVVEDIVEDTSITKR